MTRCSLYLSRDPALDYLSALEHGRVHEGQPPRCWLPVNEEFAYWRPPRAQRPRGFLVKAFDTFDANDPEVAEIWSGPRFDVPLLGLRAATAGEIVVAARAYLGNLPTLNRAYFHAGTMLSGEEALTAWRGCLEAGDPMAHFALGYTLYELGRFHEAYRHLRHYVALSPHSPWNWCWFGKGAAAIGERAEAVRAYRRAIALTAAGHDETDAPDLLAQLAGDRRR